MRLGKQSTKAEKLAKVHAARKVAADEVSQELGARALEKKRPQGQPPYPYTKALGYKMHDLLVAGIGIKKISQMDGMPCDATIYTWIGNPAHPFSELYKTAKQLMIARFEEEIQEIADEEHIGEVRTEREVLNKDGEVVTVIEVKKFDAIEHRKLRIEARRWSLSHLMPKKHGRQPDMGNTGKNEQLEALFTSLKSGPVE